MSTPPLPDIQPREVISVGDAEQVLSSLRREIADLEAQLEHSLAEARAAEERSGQAVPRVEPELSPVQPLRQVEPTRPVEAPDAQASPFVPFEAVLPVLALLVLLGAVLVLAG